MAEIKSTLELVMERTKHMSMSAEERAGQQKKGFEKKLQGLLQQYADTVFSRDELLEKMAALQKEMKIDDQKLAVSAVFQRIQSDLDNEQWLSLVRRLAPTAYTPLKQALEDYRDKVAILSQKSEQRQLENLARQYAIQGAAIVPNLRKWAHHQEELFALQHDIDTAIKP